MNKNNRSISFCKAKIKEDLDLVKDCVKKLHETNEVASEISRSLCFQGEQLIGISNAVLELDNEAKIGENILNEIEFNETNSIFCCDFIFNLFKKKQKYSLKEEVLSRNYLSEYLKEKQKTKNLDENLEKKLENNFDKSFDEIDFTKVKKINNIKKNYSEPNLLQKIETDDEDEIDTYLDDCEKSISMMKNYVIQQGKELDKQKKDISFIHENMEIEKSKFQNLVSKQVNLLEYCYQKE